MNKNKPTPQYRYDHLTGKVYVEKEDAPQGPGAEVAVIPNKLEHQREEVPKSREERIHEAQKQGRIPNLEQYAKMSDGELARHKSALLGQLAGALDASNEQNDYMVNDLMARVLSAQKLEDERKTAQLNPEAGSEVALRDPDVQAKLTQLDKADVEQVAALLEGPLQEHGDDNFMQLLSALERFYGKLEAGNDASDEERLFAYEEIVVLLELAEAMKFVSTNPVAALPPGEKPKDEGFGYNKNGKYHFKAKPGQAKPIFDTADFVDDRVVWRIEIDDEGNEVREPAIRIPEHQPKEEGHQDIKDVMAANAAYQSDEMEQSEAAEAADASARAARQSAMYEQMGDGEKQTIEDILRERYARMELPDTEEFEALPDDGLRHAKEQRTDYLQTLLDEMPDKDTASQETLDTIGQLGDELIAIDHVRQLRMVNSANRKLDPNNIPAHLHQLDLNHLLQAFPADINSVNRLNSVYYGLLHRAKAVAGHAASRELVRTSLEKVELLRDLVNRKMLMKQHGWDEASRDKLDRLKLFTKPRQDR